MKKEFIALFCTLLIVIGYPLIGAQKASDQATTTGEFIPVGTIFPYLGTTAPAGWVFAYGQEVDRIGTYAKLFAAIGTSFCNANHGTVNEAGAGANLSTCDSSKFRIPDLRGRTIAGKDNMGGVAKLRLTTYLSGSSIGSAGGAEVLYSNVTVDNHTFTQPYEHGITQPAFSSKEHYHPIDSGNTFKVNMYHQHVWGTGTVNDNVIANDGHTHARGNYQAEILVRTSGAVHNNYESCTGANWTGGTGSNGGGTSTPTSAGNCTIIRGTSSAEPTADDLAMIRYMDHTHNDLANPTYATLVASEGGNVGYYASGNGNNGNNELATRQTINVALTNNTGGHVGGAVDAHAVHNNAVNNLAPTAIANYIIKI